MGKINQGNGHSGELTRRLSLRAQHDLRPADIARVVVLAPAPTLHIIAEPAASKKRLANEYDAKFSAQYVVATCLVKGVFGLSELVDSALRDADVLALAAQIDCVPDPDAHYPTYFSGGVEIHLHDGRVLRHHEVVNRGAGDRALSAKEIEQKYFDNALLAVRRSRATDIRDAILSLDSISAVEFARVLALP